MFTKGTSGNPEGKATLTADIEEFQALNLDQRRAILKDLWCEVAFTVAKRAKALAKVCSTKDVGRLYQLVMSGAVSLDKAFPPKEVSGQTLSINLFGSLGQKAVGIVQPAVPVVEGNYKEIVHVQESTVHSSTLDPVHDPLGLPSSEGAAQL